MKTSEIKPQDVNGAYCMKCYQEREYLSATGAIQTYDTAVPSSCKNPYCSKKPKVWAILTIRQSKEVA